MENIKKFQMMESLHHKIEMQNNVILYLHSEIKSDVWEEKCRENI